MAWIVVHKPSMFPVCGVVHDWDPQLLQPPGIFSIMRYPIERGHQAQSKLLGALDCGTGDCSTSEDARQPATHAHLRGADLPGR